MVSHRQQPQQAELVTGGKTEQAKVKVAVVAMWANSKEQVHITSVNQSAIDNVQTTGQLCL